MKSNHWCYSFLLSTIAVSGGALAIDKIPDESGFSGSVSLGVSNTTFASNMVSGSGLGDVSNKRIDLLTESPESENGTGGFLIGELNYTFADTRTQLFLGNSLEDLVRYDFSFLGGIRQEVSDKGILSAAVLFSGIPAEVWADPYVTGQDRKETERDSSGGRVGWAAVMGTGLEVNFSHRAIKLDDELSGEFLGLTSVEAAKLSREGDQRSLDASYKYQFGPQHSLIPKLTYHDFDLDGAAMSKSRVDAELAYAYFAQRYVLITTASYSKADHDEVNPLYGKTESVDAYGLTLTGLYHAPFGLKGWSTLASIAGAKSDSNIDFYDAEIAKVTLGMTYRF